MRSRNRDKAGLIDSAIVLLDAGLDPRTLLQVLAYHGRRATAALRQAVAEVRKAPADERPASSSPKWLSVRQFADYYGISTTRVYQLVKEGMPGVTRTTARGKIRISLDTALAYLRKQAIGRSRVSKPGDASVRIAGTIFDLGE